MTFKCNDTLVNFSFCHENGVYFVSLCHVCSMFWSRCSNIPDDVLLFCILASTPLLPNIGECHIAICHKIQIDTLSLKFLLILFNLSWFF